MQYLMHYLLDEHISRVYQNQLRRAAPQLIVWAVGQPDAPPRSTSDPDILTWCETYGFALITNNRKSMPIHLHAHVANGRHIAAIFVINPQMTIVDTTNELILLAAASFPNEYQDRIVYLPLT